MMTTLDVCLRIVLAMLIGGIIGWERESTRRPAGLRTHMLVSVGSAVVMLTGQYSFYKYLGVANVDPVRMGAQVISGIGFLGAGTIIKDGFNIKGLTTAASLWAVACLGLCAGAGFYEGVIVGSIAIILILTVFEYLEKRASNRKDNRVYIQLLCTDASEVLTHVNKMVLKHDAKLKDINIEGENNEESSDAFHLSYKIYSDRARCSIDYTELIADISSISGVSNIRMEEC